MCACSSTNATRSQKTSSSNRTYGAGKLFHAQTYSADGFLGYNDLNAWDAFYPSLDRQLPDDLRPLNRPANGNPFTRNLDWAGLVAEDAAMSDGQIVNWGVARSRLASRRETSLAKADGSEELYDHSNDPREWRNLVSDSNYSSIKQQHIELLPQNDAPDAAL